MGIINLEDVVYPVCRSERPRRGPFQPLSAGPRIDEALSAPVTAVEPRADRKFD